MQNQDGSIENPFEEETEKPKKLRKKKKTIVFVVAEPRSENEYPILLDVLESRENTVLLHNRYNYANEKGSAVLSELRRGKSIPVPGHAFERIMRQDFWGVQQSDVVVFDLDSIDSFHLMAVAAIYDKPIVCVSETLRPIPAYFTGSVVGVFKLSELDIILKTITKKRRKRKAPNAAVEGRNDQNFDEENSDDKATSTKERIQGMLQKSFEKHAEQLSQEIRT